MRRKKMLFGMVLTVALPLLVSLQGGVGMEIAGLQRLDQLASPEFLLVQVCRDALGVPIPCPPAPTPEDTTPETETIPEVIIDPFNGIPIFNRSPESALNPSCGPACAGEYLGGDGIKQGFTPIPEDDKPCGIPVAGQCNDMGAPVGSNVYVFSHSGELSLFAVDLEIPGRGFNWKFERKYRSGITFEGPLGFNWEFNYNRRLVLDKAGNAIRMDGYTRADTYTRNPDGSYSSPKGYYTALVRHPDGSFTERDHRGTKVVYSKPDDRAIAHMTSLSDRNGNTMRFEYDGQGLLVRVLDTLGRPIEYRYDDARRLIEVEDFFNRSITFKYSENGDLVEVTSPAVSGTPNGNDFAQGKTVRYGYASGFRDNRLNHNLGAITAPNEVAAGGPPRLLVVYGMESGTLEFDRVLSQTIGGVNTSGIPAGGTINYAYESLLTGRVLVASEYRLAIGVNDIALQLVDVQEPRNAQGVQVVVEALVNGQPQTVTDIMDVVEGKGSKDIILGGLADDVRVKEVQIITGVTPEEGSDSRNVPVFQTTVTDRNGNQTEYRFNALGNIVGVREFTNRNIRAQDPEFFDSRYQYNQDGELLKVIYLEGNSVEYAYDGRSANRFQQGNLLRESLVPDAKRGGDQEFISMTSTYEPLYNQIRTVTEPRGNDAGYVPQNGGANSPERYTTVYTYDYQEGNNFATLAEKLGFDEAQVRVLLSDIPMNLGDVNGDGITDQVSGNLVRVEYPTVTLLSDSSQAAIEGSTQQPIVELFQYNQFGQLTQTVDPEGNVELYEYHPENDPDGDGNNITSEVGSSPFGYLKAQRLDALSKSIRNSGTNPEPANILIQYFYDPVGNLIKRIDGRGIATDYVINQLNQVVEVRRAADVAQALNNAEEPNWNACNDATLIECSQGMEAFTYRTQFFYDHNDNVVKRQVENRDSNNQRLAGDWITFESTYDILDNAIETTQEVSENPAEILVTRYRYDRNENLVIEISPAAVKGEQPSNIVSYVFDERDLPFTSTRGALTAQFKALETHADIPEINSISNSADVSTLTQRYDGNRNQLAFIDAADNTGDGVAESTLYLYDGFDRRISTIDALGNQSFTEYDPASNAIRISHFGPVGGESPMSSSAAEFSQPLKLTDFGQTLLSQAEINYDELSRVIERDDALFAYDGVAYVRAPILQDGPLERSNDGIVVTRYEYDRNSRRTFLIEDDADIFRTFYDGLDRVLRSIDPEDNEQLYGYDDNHNLVNVIEIEVTQTDDVRAGNVPDLRETFATINVYDSLNRLIRTTDNVGQTRRYRYDSRDNLIFTSDAQHSSNPGNLIADPLRLFPDTELAKLSPHANEGLVTNIINLFLSWLGGSTVSTQLEAQAAGINLPGNTVETFYDGINRRINEVRHLRLEGNGLNGLDTTDSANADGQVTLSTDWDANSRMISQTDDNGNTTRYAYDDLNRLIQETFADATTNRYHFDADDNRIQTVDENGSLFAAQYDGLNRLTGLDVTPASGIVDTTQQTFQYDGLSRLTQLLDSNDPSDPGDDAVVTRAYDSLSRQLEEVQNGQAISSQWEGDNNRIGLVYPDGRTLDFNYDRLDRIDTIADQGANDAIVDYSYLGPGRVLERAYANGTRLSYLNAEGTQDIGYDGLKRIISHRYLRQDDSVVAGFEYGYDRQNNKRFEKKLDEQNIMERFVYDSLYRLTQFVRDGEAPDTFQLDGVGNWANRNAVVNRTNAMNEYELVGGLPQVYDDNGNLIADGRNFYEYDAFNRLRQVIRKADNAVIATYSYDAFNRRIRRIVTNTEALNERVAYFYDGWRVIEEQQGNSTQQYVYGRRLDEALTLDQDTDNDGHVDQTLFYHDNARSYITALTDESGVVVEQYSYDAYGVPTITDASGSQLNRSTVENSYLFTGRRLDSETGLYYYRMRYFNPQVGRFLQRDPIGMWTDAINAGNAYTYVGNNPVNMLDALGLGAQPSPFTVITIGDGDSKPAEFITFAPGRTFQTEMIALSGFDTGLIMTMSFSSGGGLGVGGKPGGSRSVGQYQAKMMSTSLPSSAGGHGLAKKYKCTKECASKFAKIWAANYFQCKPKPDTGETLFAFFIPPSFDSMIKFTECKKKAEQDALIYLRMCNASCSSKSCADSNSKPFRSASLQGSTSQGSSLGFDEFIPGGPTIMSSMMGLPDFSIYGFNPQPEPPGQWLFWGG